MYQFHGCFYHGCRDCFKEPYHDRKETKNTWKSFDERRNDTEATDKYIRDQGHNLVTLWECQWKAQQQSERLSNKYHYPGEEKYRLTENEILEMVKDGTMFGALEVDIEVPDHLKDKFSEMTPIFKNVDVTQDDIGEYMRNYLDSKGTRFPDTRYLIGSMFGKKILLITPLIKWYLEHGLIVTKVHQVVQFQPKRCFQHFANQVSDDRRAGIIHNLIQLPWKYLMKTTCNHDNVQLSMVGSFTVSGDADPSKSMIAETSKLIGKPRFVFSVSHDCTSNNIMSK